MNKGLKWKPERKIVQALKRVSQAGDFDIARISSFRGSGLGTNCLGGSTSTAQRGMR